MIRFKSITKVIKFLVSYISKSSFLRFGFTGIFGSLINYSTFLFCFLYVGLEYRTSGVIGFLIPLPIVFAVNKHWTFKSNVKTIIALPMYIFTNCIALLGHSLMQYASHEWAGVPQVYSQILGICISAVINFILAKYVVFYHEK